MAKTQSPEYFREYYRKNRKQRLKNSQKYYFEGGGKEKIWAADLERKYGISSKEYNQMFTEQNGCCAVCGRHQFEFKYKLAVDHNHKSGEVRGLLCAKCNVVLGWYETYKPIFDLYLGNKDNAK